MVSSWQCRRRTWPSDRRWAKLSGKVWREYGAIDYVECVADDVKPGKVTSFPQSVKAKPNETVVFAWIVYKSRAHRDQVNKKVLADPRMKADDGTPRRCPSTASG